MSDAVIVHELHPETASVNLLVPSALMLGQLFVLGGTSREVRVALGSRIYHRKQPPDLPGRQMRRIVHYGTGSLSETTGGCRIGSRANIQRSRPQWRRRSQLLLQAESYLPRSTDPVHSWQRLSPQKM